MNPDPPRPTSAEDQAASEAVTDIALVTRCQNGDAAAFDELVTRHRTRVFAMVYNMVRNEQDAWDLAQDAFLKAWKSIGRFRGQSAFYTWLYRIVTNVTIDWIRKRKIESGMEFDDSIGLGEVEPGAATAPRTEFLPHQKLGHAEIRARIDEAIGRLTPDHRAVILLKEMDGLQYHEIAEVMDCSIGTVMSRLFYARKKLQAMLKDVYENI
jgi:RNA polymerase sigma-70 factor (ECF subfamily)